LASTQTLKYKLPVNTIYFSPSGNLLVTGHENNALCLWDIKSGKNGYKEIPGKGLLRAVAFSADEKTLLTAGKYKVINVYSLKGEAPQLLKSFETSASVKTLAFNSSANLLAAALDDGNVVMWNTENDEKTVLYSATGTKPLSMAIYKSTLVVGFTDGKIRIFDLSNPKKKYMEYNTNNTGVDFIVFSKDYKMLATVGADKSIKIFNFSNMEQNPIVLRDHNIKVRSVLFTSDNKIIAGCSDNSIRIWETSAGLMADKLCPLLKRNMKKEEWEKYVGKEFPFQKTCKDLP
jgi:WD40 repeat protein